jgi:hypothetical protein
MNSLVCDALSGQKCRSYRRPGPPFIMHSLSISTMLISIFCFISQSKSWTKVCYVKDLSTVSNTPKVFAKRRLGIEFCTPLIRNVHDKKRLRSHFAMMARSPKRDKNEDSDLVTDDVIVQNVLASNDSPFLRRAQAIKNSNLRRDANQTRDLAARSLGPNKEDAVSASKGSNTLNDTVSQSEFSNPWIPDFDRSPVNAFGAILSELSLLKADLSRYDSYHHHVLRTQPLVPVRMVSSCA